MTEKSTTEKKAELEANGYEVTDTWFTEVQLRIGDVDLLWSQQGSDHGSQPDVIDTAYAHLLAQRELVALIKLGTELANFERQLTEEETLYFVKHFRMAIDGDASNITADESESAPDE